MAVSTVLFTIFFTLVGVTLVVCTLSDMGCCKNITSTDERCNAPSNVTETKGQNVTYEIVMGPKTEFFESIERMWLVSSPTENENVSSVTIYYQNDEGKTKVFIEEIVTKISGTHSVAVAKDSNGNDVTYEIENMLCDKCYTLYYICSGKGVDTVDHRFVMTQSKIQDKDILRICEEDKKKEFRGPMIMIG